MHRPLKKKREIAKYSTIWMLTTSLFGLSVAVGFIFWKINDADRDMRSTLLKQTRLTAAALEPDRIARLTGSRRDLQKPDYRTIKGRLTAIRRMDRKSRFVYLLGKKKDRRIFFFADSEPADSGDYSPPGQIYSEASPELQSVFTTGKEITEGPLADRWGVWVSSLVPVRDRNGKIIAVLGMDIDARNWKWDIIYSSSLPIILMLVLLILLAQVLFIIRSRSYIRQNREFLSTQLEEKELLLRETHHRIMNNLTAINGMLFLQSQSTDSREAILVLQDTMGMINGMGKLYEKMLVDKTYRQIAVRPYLNDLIDSIISIFPGSSSIRVIRHLDDFTINSRQMFPLGIIVNELLTNCFKYAFADTETGGISIYASLEQDIATIVIADTGRGLPEDFDSNNCNRFGLTLVKMLCRQLDAHISFQSENGTRISIRFQKKTYRNQDP